MKLTPEQTAAVSSWIAAGESLSAVQKKLREDFSVSLTYMDVRFLVDDLNLQLKDSAPKADANDVTKAQPTPPPGSKASEKKGFFDKAKEKLGLAKNEDAEPEDLPVDDLAEDEPAPDEFADENEGDAVGAGVSVDVDKVTLHPGAMASGTVTFSDGVTGKWIIDNYGRPGFTEISQPGYRPKPADAQAFMQELSVQLQKRGF